MYSSTAFADHPSVLRGPEALLGRERKLAAVDELLHAARSGFAVLALEGEPGIGKTTVFREALRRATSRQVNVIATNPTEAEAALSLAGLADVFAGVDDSITGGLPPPQRDALAAVLLQAPDPEHGIDERALCATVLSLLRLMSAQGPLLVAVDDAHWLDTPSSRALSFAVRRLGTEPIGCLVTVRTGSRSGTFERAARIEARRTVQLGPLSVGALHAAIKQRTGRSLSRPVIVQLTQACGGNPFYAGRVPEAHDILAAVHAQAVERGEESPIPFSCFWLTWACLWNGDFGGARRPVEIEALVELGRVEQAAPMLQWFEQRAAAVDRPCARAAASRCRGLVSAALADSDGALAHLDEALAQHERMPIPFERARTLLAAGRVHRRRKEKRLAADRLAERVAELAASGLANREIAGQAFLTTKAVEANLTRVYRKVGIRSHGGHARALQDTADAPPLVRRRQLIP